MHDLRDEWVTECQDGKMNVSANLSVMLNQETDYWAKNALASQPVSKVVLLERQVP